MKRVLLKGLVATLLVTSFSVYAASRVQANRVQVVDSVSTDATQQQQAAQQQNQLVVNLMTELQALQSEVMRLSGVIEDQQYQIEQLKKQQQDDYMQLDQRLSQLNSNARSNDVVAEIKDDSTVSTADDKKAYQTAYDFIPKQQFEAAKKGFSAFITQYPQSSYVANAYYWLGELYIIDGDNEKAKQAFKTVLTQYPSHNKYPESLYKIAQINYQQGDKTTAKQQLTTLIKQYGDIQAYAAVIEKAKSFLQKNYP